MRLLNELLGRGEDLLDQTDLHGLLSVDRLSRHKHAPCVRRPDARHDVWRDRGRNHAKFDLGEGEEGCLPGVDAIAAAEQAKAAAHRRAVCKPNHVARQRIERIEKLREFLRALGVLIRASSSTRSFALLLRLLERFWVAAGAEHRPAPREEAHSHTRRRTDARDRKGEAGGELVVHGILGVGSIERDDRDRLIRVHAEEHLLWHLSLTDVDRCRLRRALSAATRLEEFADLVLVPVFDDRIAVCHVVGEALGADLVHLRLGEDHATDGQRGPLSPGLSFLGRVLLPMIPA